jgi:hypothetical protein
LSKEDVQKRYRGIPGGLAHNAKQRFEIGTLVRICKGLPRHPLNTQAPFGSLWRVESSYAQWRERMNSDVESRYYPHPEDYSNYTLINPNTGFVIAWVKEEFLEAVAEKVPSRRVTRLETAYRGYEEDRSLVLVLTVPTLNHNEQEVVLDALQTLFEERQFEVEKRSLV